MWFQVPYDTEGLCNLTHAYFTRGIWFKVMVDTLAKKLSNGGQASDHI